jgi:hypothetical protein
LAGGGRVEYVGVFQKAEEVFYGFEGEGDDADEDGEYILVVIVAYFAAH